VTERGTGVVQGPSPAPVEDDETWTVLRLMRWSGEYLEGKGVERGRLDAEHLLADVLGLERLQLYLQFDRPVVGPELDRFRPLLKRRAKREPLQYILGRVGFRELELEVDRDVLIPRPETEILLDEVLAWSRGLGVEGLEALDLGTGSGAIALSLLREGPFSRVVATDLSEAALAVARRNSEATGLSEGVEFRAGSFFDPVADHESFDLVVSNPPYVAEAEAPALQPEVRDWEPSQALFGGPDGLAAIRTIVAGAGVHLKPGGMLALEVGSSQSGPVVALLESTGEYTDVRVRRDLTGRERVVLSRRAPTTSTHST
jgi:release factor glutamine methyltransferase